MHKHIFSRHFDLLGSLSAIRGLQDKEIVASTAEGLRVYDYFFGWWLREEF